MIWFLKFFFALIVFAAIAGAGAGLWALQQFDAPGPSLVNASQGTDNTFTVERGWGLSEIAERLEQAGLISNAIIFRAGVLYNRKQQRLKAGEFAIPSGASMHEIMDILTEGKAVQYKLTVAEGLTSAMIIDLVRKTPVLSGEVTVLPVEGTLLPETYVFPRGMARDDLLRRMKQDQEAVLNALWAKRQADLPIKTKYEAVILASIVEKETGKAHERPHVAGVFVNRLRKGMKLQSDPTIIYNLTGGYPLGRPIRQSELVAATTHNTYVIPALPPTPIANPGKASLAAVLNPMQTDDLFFVADGTGGHAFAATLAEHEKNVARWRQIERAQREGTGAATAPVPAVTAP